MRAWLAMVLLLTGCAWMAGAEEKKNPVVVIETSMGEIEVELYPDKAPITVKNFLAYTNEKFFDGTIFHRVIGNFMIQGGGMTPDMTEKPTKGGIKNEADNGLRNEAGTIAMARTPDPHSASAQWFINVTNNSFLNHTSKTAQGWGYCVFGKVTSGMDVVVKIKSVKTTPGDVPVETVTIKSVREKK